MNSTYMNSMQVPMNSMKRQKYMTLKDELPMLVCAQYGTGEEWRNNSRKNEKREAKKNNSQWWMGLVMKVKSKVVKKNIAQEPGMSMNQGKLEVVKQKMARVSIDIVGISEHQIINAFEQWCWGRLLRVPWTIWRSNQSTLKDISPEYSLEGPMLKLKLHYVGHLM